MKSDINVTPFIDVLLVLLIIFMIVAPLPPWVAPVSLPRPDGEGKETGLVVEVAADRFALNRTPVWTAGELEKELRDALEAHGTRTLFVRASGGVAYHRVMEALDAAYGAGAEQIGMLDPDPSGDSRAPELLTLAGTSSSS